MKILTNLSILFLFSLFTSFNSIDIQNSDALFQKWVYKEYDNGNQIFESKLKFDADKSGIEFKKNGQITKHQNSGWCGTPPIDYELASGTWENISDSVLVLQYKTWRGLTKDTLQIIELSKSKLTLKKFYPSKKK